MVRHQNVPTDVPFISASPCLQDEVMDVRPTKNRLTLVCADRHEDDYWRIGPFLYWKVDRCLPVPSMTIGMARIH